MYLQELCWEGVDWIMIVMTENRDSWRAVVDRVMNLLVPKNLGTITD